jgi:hypothetical protein
VSRLVRPQPIAWLLIGALCASGCQSLPASEPVEIVYLNQGWSDQQRHVYYHVPGGAELLGMRYAWFRALEQPFSRTR